MNYNDRNVLYSNVHVKVINTQSKGRGGGGGGGRGDEKVSINMSDRICNISN